MQAQYSGYNMFPMTPQMPAVLPAAVPGAGGNWADSSAALSSSEIIQEN